VLRSVPFRSGLLWSSTSRLRLAPVCSGLFLCRMSHCVSADARHPECGPLPWPGTGYNDSMRITVEVPGALSGRPTDELATRARLLLVIDEVRAGQLTRAAAARALDMSLDEFLIEAGRHGLAAIDYEVDDFKRELATIQKTTG